MEKKNEKGISAVKGTTEIYIQWPAIMSLPSHSNGFVDLISWITEPGILMAVFASCIYHYGGVDCIFTIRISL